MIKIICASCLAVVCLGAEPFSPARSRLGINLSGPADWNTELPFVDVFRLSRAWISQEKGKGWGKGPALELDARGWVTRLAPDCSAETLMCTIEGGHYPTGEYVCLYEGEGVIQLSNVARVVSRSPGRIVFEPAPERGAFFLRIAATRPENYIRAIRVIMPGFEDTYRREPFHPAFLARWKHMRALRFMDWMETNGSRIAEWKDRPLPDDATWTVKGIPLEVMIDLANRLGADAWFCMPHRATDDYVRSFAAQVARELAPARKTYIEYSNEIWNSGFAQTRYAGEMGRKLGFHEKDWEAGWRYGAYRSVQIFKIWEDAFGGRDRLVRVIASQAANAYVSDVKLSFRDAHKDCDALAIAPYVSLNVSATSTPNAAAVAAWPVEQVLDHMEGTSLPEAIEWIKASKKTADKHGVALIASTPSASAGARTSRRSRRSSPPRTGTRAWAPSTRATSMRGAMRAAACARSSRRSARGASGARGGSWSTATTTRRSSARSTNGTWRTRSTPRRRSTCCSRNSMARTPAASGIASSRSARSSVMT